MLNAIKIQNFKKFDCLDLKGFSRINIIVGNNNSGKTTILEAIALASNNDFYYNLLLSLRYYSLVNPNLRSPFNLANEMINYFFNEENNLKSKFNINLKDSQIEVNVELDDKVNANDLQNINLMPSDTQSPLNNQSQPLIKNVIRYQVIQDQSNIESTIVINANGQTFPKLNNRVVNYGVVFFSEVNYTNNVSLFSEVVQSKQLNVLLDALKEFDKEILGVQLISDKFYVDIGRKRLVSINYLGAGIVKIIFLLVSVIASNNKVILIDEIENGIYYKKFSLLTNVLERLCNERNNQLFITTHSADFLKSIVGFDDYSLIRLNAKFDDGYINMNKSLAEDFVDDKNIEVR